jgi:hypothetical protein
MSQVPLFQPSGAAMVPSIAIRDPRLDPRQGDDFGAMLPDDRGTLRSHTVRVLDVAERDDTIRIYAEFFWPGGREVERESLLLWQWWSLFGVTAPSMELHRMGERWLVVPLDGIGQPIQCSTIAEVVTRMGVQAPPLPVPPVPPAAVTVGAVL